MHQNTDLFTLARHALFPPKYCATLSPQTSLTHTFKTIIDTDQGQGYQKKAKDRNLVHASQIYHAFSVLSCQMSCISVKTVPTTSGASPKKKISWPHKVQGLLITHQVMWLDHAELVWTSSIMRKSHKEVSSNQPWLLRSQSFSLLCLWKRHENTCRRRVWACFK